MTPVFYGDLVFPDDVHSRRSVLIVSFIIKNFYDILIDFSSSVSMYAV